MLITVVTDITRNDCRLLHGGISFSKNERRSKLFRFNLVITVYFGGKSEIPSSTEKPSSPCTVYCNGRIVY